MKHKWILLAVAIILMAINFLNADFSAYRQLSTAVIGIKKLWEKLRNK
jgi:hypothetical protein